MDKIERRILLIFASIVIAGVILTVFWSDIYHWRRVRESEPLLKALNEWHIRHGAYPETLQAAGITESDTLFYARQAEGTFDLWYGTTLGESVTFSSRSGAWHR